MTDQPEALRVAEHLELYATFGRGDRSHDAARLLREQHEEIEQLRAQLSLDWEMISEQREESERLREQLRRAKIDVLSEAAENAALRRDAERYRWLRTNCYSDKYPYSEFDSAMQLSFTVSGIWANNRDPSVLDGCLDTAMGDKT